MIKNTVIALVAAAALAGVAAPAMANSSLVSVSDNGFDADYVLAQLHEKGINADQVEEWGDYVAAIVTGADGKQTIAYFQPTTLEQVNL